MADIARGALGGFVNVVTNIWDVAAGQVLVEACGGRVTRIDGTPIDYSAKKTEDATVDVVAAKGHLYDKLQKIASGSREAWTQEYFQQKGLGKATRRSTSKPPNKKT